MLSGYYCTVAGLCEHSQGPQGAPGSAWPEDTELGSRNGESAPGSDAALSGKAEIALKTGRKNHVVLSHSGHYC